MTGPARRSGSGLRKAALGLLGAAVLLGVVAGVSKWREAVAARPRLAYPEARLDDAVSLRIRYFGDSVRLVRKGDVKTGRWVVEGDDFPADAEHLQRAFAALASLQELEKVSDSADASTLVECGLSPEEAKQVEWTDAEGETRRIVLGKLSGIDFGSLFWQRAGSPAVYRTPGSFVWEFSSRPVDWKDTNLFLPAKPFTPGDVRSLDVEWKAADSVSPALTLVTYRLERAGDSDFVLVNPPAAPVPASRAEAGKLFRYAAQFKIDHFVPGGDSLAADAALDDSLGGPWMTIRIGLKDGTQRVVQAGAEVESLYRYVRHASHPDPVRVFKWRLEYFRKKADFFEAK